VPWCAPVDTGPAQDGAERQPPFIGAVRSPQEHAAMVVESVGAMSHEAIYRQSIHHGELAQFHSSAESL
jgi:hypothetical protein